MTQQPIYISRQQAETFLDTFAQSVNQPSSSPVLFQVWGIGGVGKSTLLKKLQELHQQEADFSQVSFGYTMGIETPLKLMAELYQQLPQPPNLLQRDVRELLPKVDSFTPLYQNYQETAHQLETQSVDGKKSVDSEQVKLVKQLLNAGVSTVGQVVLPGIAAATLGKASEVSVDAATMILSEKDRIQNLLQQHQATKRKKDLQELMLDPLPKLTQAFAEGLIRHLMSTSSLDFDTAADNSQNCFDWLIKREFVKLVQYSHRLDDVARDVFRLSLWQEDKEQFYQVHGVLADYFKEQADREVPPDSPPPMLYNNSDWREFIAEFLYHSVFSRRRDTQHQLIAYLFTSRYFRQDEVVRIPVQAIISEADLADKCLLNDAIWQFIEKVQPAVEYGWEVLEEEQINWEFLETNGFSKSQIEATLKTCFNPINSLDGLAKFAALLYKSKRCPETQRVDWVRQAEAQAELIVTPDDAEFSSGLFLWDVGNRWDELGCYEEALASFDKAIEFKPDKHEAWYNRGNALGNLGFFEEAVASYDKAIEIKPDFHTAWYGRGVALDDLGFFEEAVASYDKAIEIKPDYHEAWNNRGNALLNLGRREEAVASYDKAIEFKPDYHEAWNNRGIALDDLGRREEAVASYDKALEFKPDYHQVWNNRGIALGNLDRLEEAVVSYDKAIEIKPDYADAFYNKACCYAKQSHIDLALENLQQAINIDPDKYREMAKTDSDFDPIRSDNQFQALIQGRTD